MVNSVFFDEIINPTELKRQQRRWLEKASTQPVTVTFGENGLAIVNREVVKNLFAEKHYAELLVRYCQELAESKGKSTVFPWLESLDDEEKKQFHDEFLTTFMKATQDNNWTEMEYLLEDWKATAEAESNPEFVEAWKERGNPEDYVTLDDGKE
jgi:hypothetical protein